MISVVVVKIHKTSDLAFQFLWAIIIFQPDDILHRSMIRLDLSLGLRMIYDAHTAPNSPISVVSLILWVDY